MLEYLDLCNSGQGEPPETDTDVPKPKMVERGRSITPRSNINASSFSVEAASGTPKKEEKGDEDDRVDVSLGACVFVPFVAEDREAEAEESPVTSTPPTEDQTKTRKRDPAPSPPKFRDQLQLNSNLNEIEIVADGIKDHVAPVEGSIYKSKHLTEEPELSLHDECDCDNDEVETRAETASIPVSDDVISVNSLFDFLTDALSFVDSTASTQKASGGTRNRGPHETQAPIEKIEEAQMLSPDIERSFSHSTMSSRSDMSHMNEEELLDEEELYLRTEILESVPEDDTMDKLIVFDKKDQTSVSNLVLRTSSKRGLLRFHKQKPSKILKKNLRSLSELVYGKRIARHNFMLEE
ncbi:hypothetical protein IV203_001769 [Nitzschia inconspicua]|uniref:Uncharacterized protein n=1 Tax=Nitzschia inconspicua TaxID=303405 RepID=A0A9K3L965_9STRA|nr:hypothetical protein IV203_001769 [Nitzschia inconspicua]